MIIKTADGERYQSEVAPRLRSDGMFNVSGKRWIKSRQAWAKTGVMRVYEEYEIEEE